MHLKNRPTYFVKDGKRKAVFYSVYARELTEAGWVPEGEAAPEIKPEPAKEEGFVKQEPPKAIEKTADSLDLDGMTRSELVEFAESNDIEFKSYASKSEILEACKEFVNG